MMMCIVSKLKRVSSRAMNYIALCSKNFKHPMILPSTTTGLPPIGYSSLIKASMLKIYPEYREDIETRHTEAINNMIEEYYEQDSSKSTISISARIGERLGYEY